MAKIVIVEDDDEVRAALKEFLVLDGHEVLDVSTGREAERLMRAHSADLLIADVFMPEMDGIDLAMRIRAHRPDAKLIVMSAGGKIGSRSVLEIAHALGAHATLPKPIRPAELRAAIETALSS